MTQTRISVTLSNTQMFVLLISTVFVVKSDRFKKGIKKREISLRFATNEWNQLVASSMTFDAMEFKVVKVEQLSEHLKDFTILPSLRSRLRNDFHT